MSEKVLCRTPNKPDGGKPCHTDAWKFDALEREVRSVLAGGESMGFMAAMRAVRDRISAEQAKEIGSVGWYATTVMLEMEFRGDLKATKVKGTKTLTLT